MNMRQSPFLEFYDVRPGDGLTENVLASKGFQQSVQFRMEDPGNQIGPILRLLSRPEVRSHFLPFRIGGHSDEIIRAAESSNEAHGVQVQLVQAPRTSTERGRQDDGCPRKRARN